MMKVYRNEAGNFVFLLGERICVFEPKAIKKLLSKGGIVFGAEKEFLQVHPMGAQIMLVIPGQKTFYSLPKGALQQMLWNPDKEYPLDLRQGLCYQCSRLKKIECSTTHCYMWLCGKSGEVVGGKLAETFVPPRRCCS